jgi:DNA-directed RNA polymerase subunit RPC12/RpoP
MELNTYFLLAIKVLTGLALLIAIFPLKNWLEIKKVREKERRWMNWLNEKPSKTEYCALHKQSPDNIQCDYCQSSRQMPSLEMVMVSNLKFGMLNNRFEKYTHFKTYICSGCGTELFRERYEE